MKRKRDGKRLKIIERVKVGKIQIQNGIEGGRKNGEPKDMTHSLKIDGKKKRYIEKHNFFDSGCFHM